MWKKIMWKKIMWTSRAPNTKVKFASASKLASTKPPDFLSIVHILINIKFIVNLLLFHHYSFVPKHYAYIRDIPYIF